MIEKKMNNSLSKENSFEVTLGEWKLLYYHFSRPSNAFKAPIVLFSGGLYLSDTNFEYEFKELAKERPIYILHMPGYGENHQEAGELEFSGYADLISRWMDRLGLEKIMPIALGSQAVMAYSFATLFPERVERLILGGIALMLRNSARLLMKESLSSLAKGNMYHFATSNILSTTNFSQKSEIYDFDSVTQKLFEQLVNLNEKERNLYTQNTLRLLNNPKLEDGPKCPTLIIVGEFDHFTTPYESFQVSKKCEKADLLIIKESDHFAAIEKRDVFIRICKRFSNEQSLKRMKDVEFYGKKYFPKDRIQMQTRWPLDDIAFLDAGDGAFVPISVIDINHFGCRLYTSFKDHKSVKTKIKLILHIPESDLKIELFLFTHGDGPGHFRGIFRHYDLDQTKVLERFIGKISENCRAA